MNTVYKVLRRNIDSSWDIATLRKITFSIVET